MSMVSAAVLGVGSLMVTLSLNAITGWSIDPSCPGTESFCDGVYWEFVVEYLPVWLYVGQLLVVLAMASPFAMVRV